MREIKILYITPGVFDKGGISRYGRFQLRALREIYGEKNVKVISLMGPDAEGFEETVNVAWAGKSEPNLLTRLVCSFYSLKIAILGQPSIVISAHVNLGPLSWLCARVAKAKLVQNIYGLEVWSNLSMLRKSALKYADLVISDCENTANYVVERGIRKNKPDVVWDCVDVDKYTPGKPNHENLDKYSIQKTNKFRLMILGRLSRDARYKGTERLLNLLSKLPDNFECVLAGGGDDTNYLQNLARKLNVVERVYFSGRILEEDMPDIYRSADVFYLVSESGESKGEGLPLTPIEAMSCGVPVVVGDQDGSREILDGRGGICVSPNDQDKVVKYLYALDSDAKFLQQERYNARARVETVFSYSDFSSKTKNIIDGLT